MRRRSFAIGAWRLGIAGTVLLGLLWALNVPFYAGAGVAHWSWRMEHGRLRIERRAQPKNAQSFYVAPNSEGLRFAPELRYAGPGDWTVQVPLWVPWLGCFALAAAGRIATRARPWHGARRVE